MARSYIIMPRQSPALGRFFLQMKSPRATALDTDAAHCKQTLKCASVAVDGCILPFLSFYLKYL